MSLSDNPIDRELDQLAEEFELLGDWEQGMAYVIDLGRSLAPLSEAEHNEDNKVRGCASQVWLVSRFEDGRLHFRGDSDALIPKGLIAIALKLYSGRRPAEILAFDAEAGFKRLGLSGALTQQRSNGLASMVRRIRAEAESLL